MEKGFGRFGLRRELLTALEDRGFDTPTPVQEQVLGADLTSRDAVVQAATGSGKTLAFALPLLNTWQGEHRSPRVLVLAPTRELALQTARETIHFGALVGVETASLVGGMEMGPQLRQLRRGAGIVVGTPGRVLDHLRRGALRLDAVHTVVLDEGDHMLDLGFRDELEAILEGCPESRRTWLFSATMPPEVLDLTRRFLSDPLRVSLVLDVACHEDISHRGCLVPTGRAREGLVNVLLAEQPPRALVFCRTREETSSTAAFLRDAGFGASALHGDMTQRERNDALESLRSGRSAVLVATDVAARGLDVVGISHVIQVGLPGDLEAFVHRSGRTGRAGHAGCNMVLVSPREARQLKALLHSSSVEVTWEHVPDGRDIARAHRVARVEEALGGELPNEEHRVWAEGILEQGDSVDVVARLLRALTEREPGGFALAEDLARELARTSRPLRDADRRSPLGGARRDDGRSRGGAFTLRLARGREQGWEVGRILRSLCSCLDVDRSEVGSIRLREDHTLVDLSSRAQERLSSARPKLEKLGLLDAAATGGSPRRRRVAAA